MTERGTGQTKAMVERMPDEGGCIITHSNSHRQYINHMIADLRGHDVARRTRVYVIRSWSDASILSGWRRHIEVDHAWYSYVPGDVAHRVDAMLDQARSVIP